MSTGERFAGRSVAVVASACALALIAGGAASATARQVHGRLVPPRARFLRTTHQAPPAAVANLSYGGAKVQVKNTNYVILWEPATLQDGSPAFVSTPYNALISRYFNDVGGNGLYRNNRQYYEIVNGTRKHIRNVSTLGGVFLDTAPYPTGQCNDAGWTGTNCVTDHNIVAEIDRVRKAQGWKVTTEDMFYVMTARGEGSCAADLGIGCSFGSWCGYHYFVGKMMYANIPYANTFNDCTTRSTFPNDADADVTLSVVSHEQMEAVTDGYYPDGWNSPSGEIGDLCAYKYGSVSLDGGKANEQWNGNYYLLQKEWSNERSACVLSGP